MNRLKCLTVIFFAMIAKTSFATEAWHDWSGPKNFPVSCGNAVATKLAQSKDCAEFLVPEASLDLDWEDETHGQVNFTITFDPMEVRNGYMTGTIAVTSQPDGTCTAGEIIKSSFGD